MMSKLSTTPAPRLMAPFELGDDAKAFLLPDLAPAAYLTQLLQREMWEDAAVTLAAALPHREAVWWACLAARQALGTPLPEKLAPALEAAEAWVYKPTEDHRYRAQETTEAIGFEGPAGLAALAAFFAGPNLAPPNPELTPVEPPPHLVAVFVATAVKLASAADDSEAIAARYRWLLAQGLDIATGGSGKEPQPLPEPLAPAITADPGAAP